MIIRGLMYLFFTSCFCLLIDADTRDQNGCSKFRLRHGKVKHFFRGLHHFLAFSCDRHYKLIGQLMIDCIDLNASEPSCARIDCPRLPSLQYGYSSFKKFYSEVDYSCNRGFTLIGQSSFICQERGWNNGSNIAMPICQANSLLQFDTCNFESEVYLQCQWKREQNLFKWTIKSSTAVFDSEKHILFDHTHGPRTEGHYLFLESTTSNFKHELQYYDEIKTGGAKFISPIFPGISDTTTEWCLIFFIYTEIHSGFFTVMINNKTAWDYHEIPETHRPNNTWTKVNINLNDQQTPFQITIFGLFVHDDPPNIIAIDDLRMASGSECANRIYTSPATESSTELTTETKIIKTTWSTTSASTHFSTTNTESPETSPLDTSISTGSPTSTDSYHSNSTTRFFSTTSDSEPVTHLSSSHYDDIDDEPNAFVSAYNDKSQMKLDPDVRPLANSQSSTYFSHKFVWILVLAIIVIVSTIVVIVFVVVNHHRKRGILHLHKDSHDDKKNVIFHEVELCLIADQEE